jgi:nitric oxide synthase oxygenase domain/subunit
MVDHHTLMKNFHAHYQREMVTRGFCPGNWKWLLSPISPTASKCYLGLNKMTEYTLKQVSCGLDSDMLTLKPY